MISAEDYEKKKQEVLDVITKSFQRVSIGNSGGSQKEGLNDQNPSQGIKEHVIHFLCLNIKYSLKNSRLFFQSSF